MNSSALIILFLLICCYKQLFVAVVYPSAALNQYCLHLSRQDKVGRARYLTISLLCIPFRFLEGKIFRGGLLRYMIYRIGLIPSCHFRRMLYKGLGVNIGRNVVFHFKTEIRSPERLDIGDGSIVGDNAILDARNGLVIGNNVNLSSNVSIYTMQHDYKDCRFSCTHRHNMEVVISDRVWLGPNVIVLPGVHLGEGSVCCAGCVVTKDVEPYSVVAGIPAHKISERPDNLVYEFDGKSCRLY